MLRAGSVNCKRKFSERSNKCVWKLAFRAKASHLSEKKTEMNFAGNGKDRNEF